MFHCGKSYNLLFPSHMPLLGGLFRSYLTHTHAHTHRHMHTHTPRRKIKSSLKAEVGEPVLRCLWHLPSTFCSLPRPASQCPAERTGGCFLTCHRGAFLLAGVPRGCLRDKRFPHPEVVAFLRRLHSGSRGERKGPWRWEGLGPCAGRTTATRAFCHSQGVKWIEGAEILKSRKFWNPRHLQRLGKPWTPKGHSPRTFLFQTVWCEKGIFPSPSPCVCESHCVGNSRTLQSSLEKHCLFPAEKWGSSVTRPRSPANWMALHPPSCRMCQQSGDSNNMRLLLCLEGKCFSYQTRRVPKLDRSAWTRFSPLDAMCWGVISNFDENNS